jgi:hypothetical protein
VVEIHQSLHLALSQASAAVQIGPALFWYFTQRRMIVCYRRFGTTYQSHLKGSGSPYLDCLTLEEVTDRLRVTSGFHLEIDESCALLGCYAGSSGNSLPTFRDNLSGPVLRDAASSGNFLPTFRDNLSASSSRTLRKGRICCLETSVRTYNSTLLKMPEHSRFFSVFTEVYSARGSSEISKFLPD